MTPSRSEPTSLLPAMPVTVVATNGMGSWSVDVMVAFERMPLREAKREFTGLIADGAVSLGYLRSCLPMDVRGSVSERNLKVIDFTSAATDFLAAIGGVQGFAQWHGLRREERDRARHLVDAEDLRDRIVGSEFVPWGAFDREGLYDPLTDDYGDLDTLRERHIDLHARLGYYPYDADAVVQARWNADAQAMLRSEAKPFLVPTDPVHWKGLSETDVRSLIADEFGGDQGELLPVLEPGLQERALDVIGGQIESDLSDEHHEDAFESVVDLDHLLLAVDRWLPHAGTGDETDLDFGRTLEAWNAKQSIVSLHAALDKVVPAFEDVTKSEIDAWCNAQVAARQAAFESVVGMMLPPVEDAEGQIKALASRGIEVLTSWDRPWFEWFSERVDLGSTDAKRRRFPTFEACHADIVARLEAAGVPVTGEPAMA